MSRYSEMFPETGEENVQSDWEELDSGADSFIKSKPIIPGVTTAPTIQTLAVLTEDIILPDDTSINHALIGPVDTAEYTISIPTDVVLTII
jgi:hypothetical protein